MEELFGLMAFAPIISILQLLSIIFSLLFMHYSAQYRNHRLSVGWYICGFLFGLWTVIVFLIKRKDFPGPNTKICYQCGDKYPDSFQMCSRCLIDLPQINPEEKKKEKKLTKAFGVAIIITYASALIVGIIMGVTIGKSVFDTLTDSSLLDNIDRISVNGVYYDKKGKCYNNEQNVALYDKEGRMYNYTVEEIINEEDELFNYNEYYFVRDDGEKYFLYDCYVTEEGWFYCDKAGLLEVYSVDTDSMSEEELDEYYNGLIESSDEEYKYYDYPYVDKDGNIYYCADEVSWNENGELITAENDPTK